MGTPACNGRVDIHHAGELCIEAVKRVVYANTMRLTLLTLSVIGVGVKLAVCLKGAKVSYVVNEKA